MKTITHFLIPSLIIGFLASSCRKDKVTVDSSPVCTDTVYFSAKILPLIISNCSTSGCHDSGSGSAGYVFSNYSDISQNATAILNSMKGNGMTLMPLGATSPIDSLIDPFNCWVKQGKLNN